jgi:lysozyme
MMKRKITKESIELIEHFEGFYPKPYLCPAGIPTIGIGTIAYPDGKKVKLSDGPITKEKAYEYLMHELEEKADRVHDFLVRKAVLLNDQQYSVLVSFAYNCGVGPIVDSGRSLNQAILSDHPLKIADCLLMYNKATKKIGFFKRTVELPGLTRRRKAERHLFLNGINKFNF